MQTKILDWVDCGDDGEVACRKSAMPHPIFPPSIFPAMPERRANAAFRIYAIQSESHSIAPCYLCRIRRWSAHQVMWLETSEAKCHIPIAIANLRAERLFRWLAAASRTKNSGYLWPESQFRLNASAASATNCNTAAATAASAATTARSATATSNMLTTHHLHHLHHHRGSTAVELDKITNLNTVSQGDP